MATRRVLLLAFALLGGCSQGPPLVHPHGKLVYKESALEIDPKASVTVVLIPVVEKGQPFDTYPGRYDRAAGTFDVPGREGKGLPPGKYRVSVTQMTPNPTATVRQMNDKYSAEKTPLVIDVKSEAPIVIQLE